MRAYEMKVSEREAAGKKRGEDAQPTHTQKVPEVKLSSLSLGRTSGFAPLLTKHITPIKEKGQRETERKGGSLCLPSRSTTY